MTNKLEAIRSEVKKLYEECEDKTSVSWLYEDHVKIVAEYAEEVAKASNAKIETSVLAALFHDLARVNNTWKDPDLMNESLDMAKK